MSKEKRISDRVRFVEDEDSLAIEIKANVEPHKQNILLVWLVLWSLIGVSILGYLFTADIPEQNTKIAFYVFLGFWLYYWYKIFRAYRWLSMGVELIEIDKDHLKLTDKVGERGLPMKYPLSEISKVSIRQVDIKSFQYQMENSFWVIGGDRLIFQHNDKPVVFGKRIEELEARKLIKLINDRLKSKGNK